MAQQLLQASPAPGDSRWPLAPTVCVQCPRCQQQRLCEPSVCCPGNRDPRTSPRLRSAISGSAVGSGRSLCCNHGGAAFASQTPHPPVFHVVQVYDCSAAESCPPRGAPPPALHVMLGCLGGQLFRWSHYRGQRKHHHKRLQLSSMMLPGWVERLGGWAPGRTTRTHPESDFLWPLGSCRVGSGRDPQ